MSQMTNETLPPWPGSCTLPICELPLIKKIDDQFSCSSLCSISCKWFCECNPVANPLWGKCEDEIHTSKSGNSESSGTLAISERNSRGQNTSPWGVFYTIGKALKCRCRKWPRMSHLDICSISYGQKGRESNWQFDSRPQKVGNRPDPGVCRWSATHRWKALKESYKFALDLIPI